MQDLTDKQLNTGKLWSNRWDWVMVLILAADVLAAELEILVSGCATNDLEASDQEPAQ